MRYVLIAVGIGITPFRSMVKYALDTQKTDHILLFHSVTTNDELLFHDVFEQAERDGFLHYIPVIGQPISESIVKKHTNDFQNTLFYISGPQTIVEKYRELLTGIGIDLKNIKTDLFTGYETV